MSTSKTLRQRTTATTQPSVDNSDLLPKEEIKDIGQTTQTLTSLEQFTLARWGIKPSETSDKIKTIIERLEKYEANMGVNVPIHSVATGAEWQLHLVNTILRALSADDEDLYKAVDLILFKFYDGRNGVYRDDMIYRFFPFIKRPAKDVNTFTRMVEILLKLSDPTQRAQILPDIRRAINLMDASYKDASFALVKYVTHQGT